jgi:hypothetical protein
VRTARVAADALRRFAEPDSAPRPPSATSSDAAKDMRCDWNSDATAGLSVGGQGCLRLPSAAAAGRACACSAGCASGVRPAVGKPT